VVAGPGDNDRVWRELSETERAKDALSRALELAPDRDDLRERPASFDAAG
jgi:hypothetical protein